MFFFKSAINKLKTYPAWSDMDTALEECVNSSHQAVTAFKDAHGPNFEKLASRQPEEMAVVLNKLNTTLAIGSEGLDAYNSTILEARGQLNKLKVLNDTIRTQRKALDDLINQAAKSARNSEELLKKYDLAKSTGQARAIAQAESKYNQANKQSQSDAKYRDENMAQQSSIDTKYKYDTYTTLVKALKMINQSRLDHVEKLGNIGTEVIELANTIPFIEDHSVDRLYKELEDLEREENSMEG